MLGKSLLALLLLMAPLWVGANERVQVTEPYLELHTGPGRGYPVFHIAERNDWVEILKRHTDWFQVRTPLGKEGWVSREEMENTLTEAGVKKTFRDLLFDDYLRRRVEFGFSVGYFERDPILTAYLGYRLHDNFLVELALGQTSGDFSSSRLIYAQLVSQPFPEQRWSPFFALGVGKFKNTPKATLVNAVETNSDLANMTIGLRYYVTRRFFLRAEFRDHIALIATDRTNAYQEYSVGISFFF